MSTTENLPPGAIVMDDERAAMLNSFPLGSVVFDDEHLADMKTLPIIDAFPDKAELEPIPQ